MEAMSVRFPADVKKALREEAKRQGCTMNLLVVLAVRDYLQKVEADRNADKA